MLPQKRLPKAKYTYVLDYKTRAKNYKKLSNKTMIIY